MSDLNRLPRGSRATPSNAGREQGAPRWPGSSRKLDSTTGDLHEVGKAVAFSSRCSFPNSSRESGGEGLERAALGAGGRHIGKGFWLFRFSFGTIVRQNTTTLFGRKLTFYLFK
jgi:hypothetical protein